MNLRRLSALMDRERLCLPERMPLPPLSSGKKINNLKMLAKNTPSFQPTRMAPPRNLGADTKPNQPSSHFQAGPSWPSKPKPATNNQRPADDLDGISALPSTSVKEQSRRSVSRNLMGGSSQHKSRIPQKSGSKGSVGGSSKRKSFLAAKKRLSMSSKPAARRALHPRLAGTPSQASPVASRKSADSTKEFEADELAAAMPTPGPAQARSLRRPASAAASCPCKCTDSLQEVKVVHKEMIDLLARQTETINRQNEIVQKQNDVLIKLNSLLDKNINFFSMNVGSHQEDMEMVNDKENEIRDANQSVIGERATKQYNEIRSGLNFLSLRTPARSVEARVVSPKTPKSLLSRTLQLQLGDIFEES